MKPPLLSMLFISILACSLAQSPGYATPLTTYQNDLDGESAVDRARKIIESLSSNTGSANARQRLQMADRHFRAGRIQDAVQELEQVNRQEPSLSLKVALGELYNRVGRYDDAIIMAREVIKGLPQSAQPHDIIGTAYLRLNKPDQAVPAYRQVISKAPDMAIGYHHLGDAYWTLGRNKDALAQYQEAIKRDPGLVDALIKSAAVLQELGDKQKALEGAQIALRASPNNPLARSVLGEAYLALGDYAKAEAQFRAAAALQPNFAYFQERLGETYIRQNDTAKALAVYRQIAERDPTNTNAHRQLAKLFAQTGELALAQYQLGLSAFLDNNLTEATTHYLAAIKANSKLKGAYLDLTVVYLKQKKWSDASRSASKATLLDPKDATAMSLLGQAYLGSGKVQEAERALMRSVQVDGRYAPSHLHLAEIFARQKRCREAADHYGTAQRLGSGSEEIQRLVRDCR